ncbi:Metalloenzyme, LuxS/M16 peptidase-like protein [Phakopsora pachyrhizi]|nr:Metalloenzyme, LuxS/M16 peptidase-like protein [Phakopsora pachyrhizi]
MLLLPSRSIWRSARSYATHASSTITTNQSNSGIKVLASEDESKLTSSISATDKRSALSVVREAELLGGVLTSSLTREHLILSAEFIKGNEGYFSEILGDVLTRSKYLAHEFKEETIPALAAEYHQAHLDSTVVALDLAHQVAFRKGLGNSLFANPQIPIAHDSAVQYARSAFSSSNQHLVIGTGVESSELTKLVNQFFSSSTASKISSAFPQSSNSKYFGGESRLAAHLPNTFLIAFQGGANVSKPEFTVLQHVLGSYPSSVKWSQGISPLSSVPVRSFHLPYSDTGLFGFIVKASGAEAKTAGSRALAELKNVASGNGIDQDSVGRAIKKAQFLVASGLENNFHRSEILGSVSLASKSTPQQLQELYSSYGQVTPDKVIEAAKTAIGSRPSTVAVGNVHELPYVEDLGL